MIRKAIPKDASRLAEILIFAKRTAYRPFFQHQGIGGKLISDGEKALQPGTVEYLVKYIKKFGSWQVTGK